MPKAVTPAGSSPLTNRRGRPAPLVQRQPHHPGRTTAASRPLTVYLKAGSAARLIREVADDEPQRPSPLDERLLVARDVDLNRFAGPVPMDAGGPVRCA